MINKHINLGEINTLKIDRETEPGLYLIAEDEEVVLLPNAYVEDSMEIGDLLEVFIYTDSEDRLVATTETPYGMKGQFTVLKVVDIAPFGAFLDWGLPKDLFVPKNKQKTPFELGQKRIVRIIEDEETNRLIGVEKITSFLSNKTKELKKNQEVDILIFAKTPLGFKAIIDNRYEGMIYHNEIFTKVNILDSLNAFVKEVRKDGKVDLCLQPIGKEKSDSLNTKKILDLLNSNDGELFYNYKTEPKIVKEVFGMSKKAYKRALSLLVEEKIILVDDTIELVS